MTVAKRERLETVIANASEAIHRAARKEWIASSQVLLAMTNGDATPHLRPSLRAQAKQSIEPQRKNGLLRRFAPRNDV
jgi:hypothetical protein